LHTYSFRHDDYLSLISTRIGLKRVDKQKFRFDSQNSNKRYLFIHIKMLLITEIKAIFRKSIILYYIYKLMYNVASLGAQKLFDRF